MSKKTDLEKTGAKLGVYDIWYAFIVLWWWAIKGIDDNILLAHFVTIFFVGAVASGLMRRK